jgi:peptide chain release factor 2
LQDCSSASISSWSVFDIAQKEKEAADLAEQAAAAGFWLDQQGAQISMRRLSGLQDEIGSWRNLQKRVDDLAMMAELAQAENDETLTQELTADAQQIARELDEREFVLMLGGEHDANNAILAVLSGAGGIDAQDWAEMLQRMYMHWAERRGFAVDILDLALGEEAGIKSVTLAVHGRYAYGYLRAERGVHRLVRLSPFDSAHRRHTSFALVEVMPEVDNDVEVQVNPEDLRIDIYHSSGHGGQNVQKVSTAVRITHLPTGIVATCQNERSQLQNKETAMSILRARLLERELEKQEEERAKLKGAHVSAEWGNQIRSYVLHPYNMVKDHRTDHETGNTTAVLNGEIDDFIEAYLKQSIVA